MAGLTPMTADEVNERVGNLLRQFVDIKDSIDHMQANLAPLTLTDPPYDMTPVDDTTIKSAVNGLDTALDAVDMTFINRLIGIW